MTLIENLADFLPKKMTSRLSNHRVKNDVELAMDYGPEGDNDPRHEGGHQVDEDFYDRKEIG